MDVQRKHQSHVSSKRAKAQGWRKLPPLSRRKKTFSLIKQGNKKIKEAEVVMESKETKKIKQALKNIKNEEHQLSNGETVPMFKRVKHYRHRRKGGDLSYGILFPGKTKKKKGSK